MSERLLPGGYVRIDEERTYPLPDPDCEWQLRYGTPDRQTLLKAASILSAYRALLNLRQKSRNRICSSINRALLSAAEREEGEW